MIDNEIYSKIKKHYLYNKSPFNNEDNIYFLSSMLSIVCFFICLPLSFLYFKTYNLNHKLEIIIEVIYSLYFSFIVVLSFFMVSSTIIKYIFKSFKPEKILINKYQEEIILYSKENMPKEHELLNNILNYIREMKNLGNKVINLENNSKYRNLLEKVMEHEFELNKKYDIKINDLKIWLETKIIEYHISGYDVDKNIGDYFDDNKLKRIFLKEGNYHKYKSIINNNKYLYNDLYETDIEKAIHKFKEGFIKNEI